jgi:endonuclease/exonuclease/phosphatase family metal-dependent hydrolase
MVVAGICVYLLHDPARGKQYPNDAFYSTLPECFTAPTDPGDRRKDKKHLKVANFNAEWLFLYGGRGGIRCPAESCPWTNTIEALNHISEVGRLLSKIDADVIHLSEVEDCRVLRNLLAHIPGEHGYNPYVILGKDHSTGQSVALLTRIDPHKDMVRTDRRAQYPIPGTLCKSHLKRGSAGITKHYAVPINVDNGAGEMIPFVFAGLHLLARPSDKARCTQREAQASVLRDLVRSMSKDGERIIMMGDYNDFDERAIGIDGRRPITSALSILYGSSGTERTLKNAAATVPVSERYSCWFDVNQNCRVDGSNEKVMIDHILLDDSLDIVESQIHHVYQPSCDLRVSDHWPFSVKIKL